MRKQFLLLLVADLGALPLLAQQSDQPDSTSILPNLLITYAAGAATPVTYRNISRQELERRNNGQEPSFLLASESPSLSNYSDGGGYQGYSYYRLRGIDQTRINMTFDGVPLNEPEDQGAYFSNYPDLLQSVSRIQLQRGVGTSKNGTASYGGSVQLFAPDLSQPESATLGAGYGSYHSLRAFGEYNSGLRKGLGFYARGSEIYSDGYKYHSGNHSQSLFLSGGRFGKKSSWRLNALAGQQRNELAWIGVADSVIARDPKSNANENEHDSFIQCLLQLRNSTHLSTRSQLESSIYFTNLKGGYDFNLNAFLGQPTTSEMYRYDFRSQLAGAFVNYTMGGKRIRWTGGLHANTYQRRHSGSEHTTGPLYSNTGFKQEWTAFAKAEVRAGAWSLFTDLQYRHVHFTYKGSVACTPFRWSFVNPKAGLSRKISSSSMLYYSIGITGREPTRNDLFGGNDDLLADSTGTASLFIKTPEYVIDQELGLRHVSERLQLDVNLFYMNFRNEIVLDGKFGPNGLALTNKVDQSIRGGVELSASWQFLHRLQLRTHSAFNYSRIREQRESFEPVLTPPLMLNIEALYEHGGLSLALNGRYQSRSFIDFANSAWANRFFLLGVRAGYTRGAFDAAIFINNLTNMRYFVNGYMEADGTKKYFAQAPANLFLSLKYRFGTAAKKDRT